MNVLTKKEKFMASKLNLWELSTSFDSFFFSSQIFPIDTGS